MQEFQLKTKLCTEDVDLEKRVKNNLSIHEIIQINYYYRSIEYYDT